MAIHGTLSNEIRYYILELLVCGKEFTRKEIVQFLKEKTGKNCTSNVLTHCFNDLKAQGKIVSISRGIYAISRDYVPESKKSIQAECIDILEKTKDDLIRAAKGVSHLTITPAEKIAIEKIRQAVSELEKMKGIFR